MYMKVNIDVSTGVVWRLYRYSWHTIVYMYIDTDVKA